MRDKDATVRGTLHGAKDTGTRRGARETDVEEALERTRLALNRFGELELTGRLGDTLVLVGKAELRQSAASAEETGGVAGRPVGQAMADTVPGELVGVGGRKDHISLELGRDDLADHVLVRDADDQAVLRGGVLVLGLDDEALPGVVVRLALTATTVLDLVPREVGRVLLLLDESCAYGECIVSLLGTSLCWVRQESQQDGAEDGGGEKEDGTSYAVSNTRAQDQ